MTKTPTEQWREGTLPTGNYYIRVKEQEEEKIIEHKIAGSAFFYDQNVLLEIVAPVPSYDKYQKLQRKLEIATKALEEITDLAGNNENGINDYGIVCCAQDALQEMEGVK